MSVLMRRENTLIIEPGSDISKIQIINFILLPNSKKHFEGPPLYVYNSNVDISNIQVINNKITASNSNSINQQFTSCSSIFSQVTQITQKSFLVLSLKNAKVSNMNLYVNGSLMVSGVIFANNQTLQFIVNYVSTEGINTINDIIIANCGNVVSQFQNGC
ncbi:Hypothetical_protein [Hexamita inflata]|uniref:Hypothetical_protein n=1 Tax=Hexamita inflata TaxID=28002 RepID=A0ABP1HF52_9EUKA